MILCPLKSKKLYSFAVEKAAVPYIPSPPLHGIVAFFLLRQAFEQYFTSSQFFSHFLRQVNGRSQTGQIFCGKSLFFI